MSVDVNVDMEEIDELVDKIEAEVAKMEAKKADAKKTMEANQKEPCQKEEPIYPVRFSIKKSSIAYADSIVEHTFPKLQHSTYTLRTLRLGYIYMYYKKDGDDFLKVWCVKEDGEFQQMIVKTEKNNAKYIASATFNLDTQYEAIFGESLPYILAPAHKDVYIGFADVLWTSNIAQKVIDDATFREKIMTKIGVDGWSEKSPDKDTFAIDKLDELVEEYISPDGWRDTFDWAEKETVPKYPDRTTDGDKKMKLENLMKQVPRKGDDVKEHPVKPIGVMLYDNIGLVQDLGSLIKKFRKAHMLYTDDMNHKKLISDFIEAAYKRDFSFQLEKNKVITDRKLKKYHTLTGLAKWGHELFSDDYEEIYGDKDVNSEEFSNRLYKEKAEDKVKLINEEARLFFKKQYKDELQKEAKKLAKKVVESKNDRYIHLSTFLKDSLFTDLGCSFLNYDRSYNFETETCENGDKSAIVSSYQSTQVFASCVEGMMDGLPVEEHIINREHEQWETFLTNEKSSPFIFDVFKWSFENKIDSLATIFNLSELLGIKAKEENNAFKDDVETKEQEKLTKEVEKRLKKSEARIKGIEKRLEIEIEQAKETSYAQTHRELTKVEKAKQLAHEASEQKLKEQLKSEKIKNKRLEAKLKVEKRKLKNMRKSVSHEISQKNTILKEFYKQLDRYPEEVISKNIMQYTLNRTDLNDHFMKGVIQKFERIQNDGKNNISLLSLEFTEEGGKKRVHANPKYLKKVEISRETYLEMFLSEDASDLSNKILHIDDRLSSEKIAVYVIVDDVELLELQNNIDDFEKELKTLATLEKKREEQIERVKQAEKDLANRAILDAEKINDEALNRTTEIETDATKEKERILQNSESRLNSEIDALKDKRATSIFEELQSEKSALVKLEAESLARLKEAENRLDTSLRRWIGGVEVTSNVFVSIFNVINLKAALISFNKINSENSSKERIAAFTNLAGAMIGTAGAIYSITTTVPKLSRFYVPPSTQGLVKAAYYKGMLITQFDRRILLFGAIASTADAITGGMNSWIQFDENNDKSGYINAVATVFLTVSAGIQISAGLGYVLIASSVISVMVVVILALVGLVAMMIADSFKWDEFDKWLTRCFFRMTEEFVIDKKLNNWNRFITKDGEQLKAYHPSLVLEFNDDYVDIKHVKKLNPKNKQAEILGFLMASYNPRLTIDWDYPYLLFQNNVHNRETVINIDVNFPVKIDPDSFRYGIHKRKPKPEAHSLENEVVPREWKVTSSFNYNSFHLKISNVIYTQSEMYLTLSYKVVSKSSSTRYTFYYKIYDNDSTITLD